ncbi:hypothetical protein D3C78_1581560 [compost metagenome]
MEPVMINTISFGGGQHLHPLFDCHRRVARYREGQSVVLAPQENLSSVVRKLRPFRTEMTHAEAYGLLITIYLMPSRCLHFE